MSSVLEIAGVTVAAINLATFLAFGFDKWSARRQARRVPEAWLLALTWSTGFVGGWIAMNVFRHKTRKTSFKIKMVAATVLNLAWPAAWLLCDGFGRDA